MTDHKARSLDLAGKITDKAIAALSPLDRETAVWPTDFRAIMWDAVAETASRYAAAARDQLDKKKR